MKPRYQELSDAAVTEEMRARIGRIKQLLTDINSRLREAGGRE